MAIDGVNNNQAKLQQKQDDFGTFADKLNKTVPDRTSTVEVRRSCWTIVIQHDKYIHSNVVFNEKC